LPKLQGDQHNPEPIKDASFIDSISQSNDDLKSEPPDAKPFVNEIERRGRAPAFIKNGVLQEP